MTLAPPREAVDLAAGNVVFHCTTCGADRGAIPVDPADLTATPWRCSWQREHGGHLLPCPDCGALFTYLHVCEATMPNPTVTCGPVNDSTETIETEMVPSNNRAWIYVAILLAFLAGITDDHARADVVCDALIAAHRFGKREATR